MDRLKDIAETHKLFLIEDTAESAFSKYKGRYAGTFGATGCFSFRRQRQLPREKEVLLPQGIRAYTKRCA